MSIIGSSGSRLAFFLLVPSVLTAQTAQEWRTALGGTLAAPVATGDLKFGSAQRHPFPAAGMPWIITCAAPFDCRNLAAQLLSPSTTPGRVDTLAVLPAPAPAPAPTQGEVHFSLFGGSAESTLELWVDSTKPTAPRLKAALVQAAGGPAIAPGAYAIDASCPDPASIAQRPRSLRDTTFMHHFFVDYLGNVLVRPTYPVDDRSPVLVTVLAKSEAVPRLRVGRLSAFRSVGTINLMGAGQNASQFIPHSSGTVAMSCRRVILSDFASGKGEIEIAVVTDDGKSERLGSFDFAVNPTFTGALSFGAIRTPLLDPEFGLAVAAGDTVITAQTDGVQGVDRKAHRILYTVVYTHYMWGRRDTEKARPLIERFNPMVGVVLNNIPNNFIAGATFDLFDGVFLSGGAHSARVRGLDPDAGLSLGDQFSGTAKDIPVRRSWKTKFFVGVTIDLRAATELFKAALAPAGG